MKTFDEKTMDALKEVQKNLFTTYYCGYKKSTTAKQNEMVADIWDEYTGQKMARNFVCGTCLYNLYKRVAEVYFHTQDEMSKHPEEVIETSKPKRGRPKKKA